MRLSQYIEVRDIINNNAKHPDIEELKLKPWLKGMLLFITLYAHVQLI